MSTETWIDRHVQAAGKAAQKLDLGPEQRDGLNERRRLAWSSLLTSLANSENIESLILDPLIAASSRRPALARYLRLHSKDEVKHFRWLTAYVKEIDPHRAPRKKSLSTRIFYDFALPRLGARAATTPGLLYGLMLFYEVFTVDFYGALKKQARADGLKNLVKLISEIEKDEHRHCAAAKALLSQSLAALSSGEIARLRWETLALLRFFQFDMAIDPWCLHNRRVRQSVTTLGLKAPEVRRMSNKGLDAVMDVFEDYL